VTITSHVGTAAAKVPQGLKPNHTRI